MLKYNSSAGKGYLKTIGAVKGSEITTGSVHIWFRRWDELSCTRSDGGQGGHVTITTTLCVARDSSTDVHPPDVMTTCTGGEALRWDIFE